MSAKNEQEKHKKLSVEVWCVFVDLPFRQKIEVNGFHKVLSWETTFFQTWCCEITKIEAIREHYDSNLNHWWHKMTRTTKIEAFRAALENLKTSNFKCCPGKLFTKKNRFWKAKKSKNEVLKVRKLKVLFRNIKYTKNRALETPLFKTRYMETKSF